MDKATSAPGLSSRQPDDQAAQWVGLPWMGFDTETTGVSTSRDRIVTAATVTRGRHASHAQIRTWLTNPGVPIPAGATAIHGVSTEHARRHGRAPADVLEEVNAELAAHLSAGRAVVVFNAAFDLPLLERESVRHKVAPLSARLGGEVAPVVDPLVLDRALDRYRKGKRTLSAMAGAYGVALPEDTHQAHVDALLTLEVLAAIVTRHATVASMSPAELMGYQREAHATWADSFERYLASKGRQARISRTWI